MQTTAPTKRGTVPARRIVAAARERARRTVDGADAEAQLGHARRFTHRVLRCYWRNVQQCYETCWPLPEGGVSFDGGALSDGPGRLARQIGEAAARLGPVEAGYRIGGAYTALLPRRYRARHGVYYTPPPLAERLLDAATEAGVDWTSDTVLDPACGGGAFLAPVALRMAEALRHEPPSVVVDSIADRLRGNEIDPFGAWISQVMLEAALMDVCRRAERRVPPVVEVCDSLSRADDLERFDLVIGNPPYGRARLSKARRKKYARSLFGHANLYGLFYDLAFRRVRPGGVVALLTPASFLAGEYSKALRGLLGREARPVNMDFIAARKDVFDDVLQEALLATYRRSPRTDAAASVHVVSLRRDESLGVEQAGRFAYPNDPSRPWLVPRAAEQGSLVERMRRMPDRLSDYGYVVNTGPLVWNRHKPQLRSRKEKDCYPLIWAEAVTPDGRFVFRAERRNHEPYFAPEEGEEWLITREPCILLQRTTAKEQHRRLIAAELPASFISKHGAVVIENHLNILRPEGETPSVAVPMLAALLRSSIVDQAFRCMSGSVAVSAYELNALPLPAPEALGAVEAAVQQEVSFEEVDRLITSLYMDAHA